MKRIILFSALALFLSAMGGCEKEDIKKHSECQGYSHTEKKKVYVYGFHSGGDEEGSSIVQQAKHFKVSEMKYRSEYTYKPKDNYIGTDSVEIETYRLFIGSGSRTIRYKIKFHITQCGMRYSKKIVSIIEQ